MGVAVALAVMLALWYVRSSVSDGLAWTGRNLRRVELPGWAPEVFERLLLVAVTVAFTLAIAGGSLPPIPFPPLPPIPDVDPAPFPADGLTVLIVEESTARSQLSQDQLDILTAGQIYLDQAGAASMILDPDTEGVDMPPWREAFSVPRQSLPWVVISNGRNGFTGPLPADLDAFRELVGRFD